MPEGTLTVSRWPVSASAAAIAARRLHVPLLPAAHDVPVDGSPAVSTTKVWVTDVSAAIFGVDPRRTGRGRVGRARRAGGGLAGRGCGPTGAAACGLAVRALAPAAAGPTRPASPTTSSALAATVAPLRRTFPRSPTGSEG